MKKSEFVKRAVRSVQHSDCVYDLVELAEGAGVEWDPEEPELPKRLTTVPFGTSRQLATEDDRRILTADEYDESAARWNTVSRLCNSDHPIYPKTIEDIVRQEREKLQ